MEIIKKNKNTYISIDRIRTGTVFQTQLESYSSVYIKIDNIYTNNIRSFDLDDSLVSYNAIDLKTGFPVEIDSKQCIIFKAHLTLFQKELDS